MASKHSIACKIAGAFFVCGVLFWGSFALAEEPKAEEKDSEKKEGAAAPVRDANQQAWYDLQARIMALKAKIRGKSDSVKRLIQEKEGIKDEKQAVTIVNQLKADYKELQTAVKEYEEQRSLAAYRFPEKGRSEGRVYERIEMKTLDQMESEFSLEGKVSKVLARLRRQYPDKNLPEKSRRPASLGELPAKTPIEDNKSRDSVTIPQVLSK